MIFLGIHCSIKAQITVLLLVVCPEFADNEILAVVVCYQHVLCTLEVEQICSNDFPWTLWDFMWSQGFLLLGWLVLLANGTAFDQFFDVLVDVVPVNRVLGSQLGFFNPLVSIL